MPSSSVTMSAPVPRLRSVNRLSGLLPMIANGWIELAGQTIDWISPFAFGFGIVLTFFELLVQVLQAYIFTLLSSLYIAGALAEEH